MRYDMTIDRYAIVVDDEPMFLKFASIPFRTGFCGFCTWNIHAFTEPSLALDFYRQNAASVDVIVTDDDMPAMSGTELIRQMRAGDVAGSATVPAVVMSSHPSAGADLPPSVTLLRKPFTGDDIARSLCASSLICETGNCPGERLRSPKPRPNSEGFRATSVDEHVTFYG